MKNTDETGHFLVSGTLGAWFLALGVVLLTAYIEYKGEQMKREKAVAELLAISDNAQKTTTDLTKERQTSTDYLTFGASEEEQKEDTMDVGDGGKKKEDPIEGMKPEIKPPQDLGGSGGSSGTYVFDTVDSGDSNGGSSGSGSSTGGGCTPTCSTHCYPNSDDTITCYTVCTVC